MTQIIVQSFIRAEVTIGVVLSILLISGRTDPQAIAFSLGGIGAFLLLYGLLPLSRRSRPAALAPAKEEEEPSSADGQATSSDSGCSKTPTSRLVYFVRAAVTSAVIIGTAFLIYWFAPPLV